MRLTYDQIESLSERIVRELDRAGIVDVDDKGSAVERVRQIVVEELRVEDRLNEEVRELMQQHRERIRRADVEYHEMFKAIKSKLAKERDIIL